MVIAKKKLPGWNAELEGKLVNRNIKLALTLTLSPEEREKETAIPFILRVQCLTSQNTFASLVQFSAGNPR